MKSIIIALVLMASQPSHRSRLTPPKLAVVVSGPETVVTGADIPLTVTVKNTGGLTATNVVVSFPLPAGFEYQGRKPGSVIRSKSFSLRPGKSQTWMVTVTAGAPTTVTSHFTVRATVRAWNAPTVRASFTTTIVPPVPNLSITMDWGDAPVLGGAQFVIHVRNVGGAFSPVSTVILILPQGVEFPDPPEQEWKMQNDVFVRQIDPLEPGRDIELTFALRPTPGGAYRRDVLRAVVTNFSQQSKECSLSITIVPPY